MLKKRIVALLLALMMLFGSMVIATANDKAKEWDPKNQSYAEYFENEHGFYSDTATQSKAYLNYKTGLFSSLVEKQGANILYKGKEVSGIIGNSEMVFFAVDNTVYRYHVKSKRVDKLFTEPMMESFYPITSEQVLWKRASTKSLAKAELSDQVTDVGVYYILDIKEGKSYATNSPNNEFAKATSSASYTHLSSWSSLINGRPLLNTFSSVGEDYIDVYHANWDCNGTNKVRVTRYNKEAYKLYYLSYDYVQRPN